MISHNRFERFEASRVTLNQPDALICGSAEIAAQRTESKTGGVSATCSLWAI